MRQNQSTEEINFNHLVMDIAWFGLGLAATSRFMSLFAIRMGADATELSLIASLPGLLLLISTGLSAWWRRRHSGTIKALFWPAFGFRLIFLLPVFAPFFPPELRPLWLILAATLPALPQGIAGAIFVVMMREAVSGERFNRLLSQRALAMNITVGIGALVFGILLEKLLFPLNYQVMFGLAWAFSLLSLWYVSRIKILFPEQLPQDREPQRSVWLNPTFHPVAFAGFATHMAFFAVVMVTPLYLVEDFGAGEGFIALFGVLELMAGALAAAFTAQALRRFGTKLVTSVGMVGTALALLIIGLAPSLEWTLIAAVISGATWTIVTISIFAYFAEQVPPSSTTQTQASVAFQQMNALGIFVGPLLGAALIDLNLSLVNVIIMGVALRLAVGLLIQQNPFMTLSQRFVSRSSQAGDSSALH